MLYKSRCIVFHRNHCLAWSLKAILRCVCTQFTISVNHYICISVVCCYFGLFSCVCVCSSRKTTYVTGTRPPMCTHVWLFSTVRFQMCPQMCPLPHMCTYVSPLCVFLKCAHAPMFTHGSQYSFTAQLDLGCFLSIYCVCLSLVFHLHKY